MMASTAEQYCQGEPATCSCQSKLQRVLYQYFGYSSFRPGQLEASLAVMHGKDVVVRMATGSGKSLCMFLGPLAKNVNAVGVIISPLNALMDQQVCFISFLGIIMK